MDVQNATDTMASPGRRVNRTKQSDGEQKLKKSQKAVVRSRAGSSGEKDMASTDQRNCGDFVGGLVSTGDIVLSEGDTRVDLITLDGIWDVIASEADTDYAYLGPTGEPFLRVVWTTYPYFTSHSEILRRILQMYLKERKSSKNQIVRKVGQDRVQRWLGAAYTTLSVHEREECDEIIRAFFENLEENGILNQERQWQKNLKDQCNSMLSSEKSATSPRSVDASSDSRTNVVNALNLRAIPSPSSPSSSNPTSPATEKKVNFESQPLSPTNSARSLKKSNKSSPQERSLATQSQQSVGPESPPLDSAFSPSGLSASSGLMSNKKPVDMLTIDLNKLAQHFRKVQYEIIQELKLCEFYFVNWEKPDNKELSPTILKIVDYFNTVCYWAATSIVIGSNQKKTRGKLVGQFILLAEQLVKLSDFSTSMAIFSALNLSCVTRLKSWKNVPKHCISVYKELETLLKPTRNYANYRAAIQNQEPPFIPYIGLMLQDLIMIEETPTWQDIFHSRTNYSDDDEVSDAEHPFVDWQKMKSIARVLELAKSMKRVVPTIKEDPILFDYLKNLEQYEIILTDEELYGYKEADGGHLYFGVSDENDAEESATYVKNYPLINRTAPAVLEWYLAHKTIPMDQNLVETFEYALNLLVDLIKVNQHPLDPSLTRIPSERSLQNVKNNLDQTKPKLTNVHLKPFLEHVIDFFLATGASPNIQRFELRWPPTTPEYILTDPNSLRLIIVHTVSAISKLSRAEAFYLMPIVIPTDVLPSGAASIDIPDSEKFLITIQISDHKPASSMNRLAAGLKEGRKLPFVVDSTLQAIAHLLSQQAGVVLWNGIGITGKTALGVRFVAGVSNSVHRDSIEIVDEDMKTSIASLSSYSQQSPKSWTCEDVSTWLQMVGFGSYINYFDGVTGIHLLDITEESLLKRGIEKRSDRKRLSTLIGALSSSQELKSARDSEYGNLRIRNHKQKKKSDPGLTRSSSSSAALSAGGSHSIKKLNIDSTHSQSPSEHKISQSAREARFGMPSRRHSTKPTYPNKRMPSNLDNSLEPTAKQSPKRVSHKSKKARTSPLENNSSAEPDSNPGSPENRTKTRQEVKTTSLVSSPVVFRCTFKDLVKQIKFSSVELLNFDKLYSQVSTQIVRNNVKIFYKIGTDQSLTEIKNQQDLLHCISHIDYTKNSIELHLIENPLDQRYNCYNDTSDIVIVTSQSGIILHMNPSALKHLGKLWNSSMGSICAREWSFYESLLGDLQSNRAELVKTQDTYITMSADKRRSREVSGTIEIRRSEDYVIWILSLEFNKKNTHMHSEN